MHIDTDLLIIGGGSAGCLAALAARAHSPAVAVTILEKGGFARLSLPNSGYLYGTFDFPGNARDGYAMAYRAGAQLTGFEYILQTVWWGMKAKDSI